MLDFNNIRTIPIKTRKNKESHLNFIRPGNDVPLLKNKGLDKLVGKIIEAYEANKKIIFMFGGHVIKVGCAPLIVDMLRAGVINHIAVNGAVSIHDFEIALIGETSEDVATTIEDGTFGMSEETGRMMCEAINKDATKGMGWGAAIGKMIAERDLPYKGESIQYWAYILKIPFTVHTGIGTEIIYQHPACDGASMGKASYDDFKLLTGSISGLEGGVVVNLGSAVIMPEVFLKSFTIARNLGSSIKHFTAANLDMIDHYRPRVNVVQRPTSLGGQGITVIAKHQETIPTLHRKVMEAIG